MKREHSRIPVPATEAFACHGGHPCESAPPPGARAVRQAARQVMQAAGAACLALASNLTWAADGGVGIVATGGAHVTVCSTVRGGLASDGSTRAAAVQFTGGGNVLTLQANHIFEGAVMGGVGDTLALGGSGSAPCPGTTDGSFDLGAIGSTFQGFETLAKTGPSTWTLTGQGPGTNWAVQGGALRVDGSVGGARASGGVLGGSGNAGALVLDAGGAIAPGDSPGTLNGASLIWNGGGAFQFELGATPAGSDLLVLSGALTQGTGGGFAFHFSDGADPPQTGRYPLIQFASQSGFAPGDFSHDYSGAAGGLQGHFELGATELDFVVTRLGPLGPDSATPIPTLNETLLAMLAALLAGAAAVGWRRAKL